MSTFFEGAASFTKKSTEKPGETGAIGKTRRHKLDQRTSLCVEKRRGIFGRFESRAATHSESPSRTAFLASSTSPTHFLKQAPFTLPPALRRVLGAVCCKIPVRVTSCAMPSRQSCVFLQGCEEERHRCQVHLTSGERSDLRIYKLQWYRLRCFTLSSTLTIFFSMYSLIGAVTSKLFPVTMIGAFLASCATAL